jgi:hypothetical protein
LHPAAARAPRLYPQFFRQFDSPGAPSPRIRYGLLFGVLDRHDHRLRTDTDNAPDSSQASPQVLTKLNVTVYDVDMSTATTSRTTTTGTTGTTTAKTVTSADVLRALLTTARAVGFAGASSTLGLEGLSEIP